LTGINFSSLQIKKKEQKLSFFCAVQGEGFTARKIMRLAPGINFETLLIPKNKPTIVDSFFGVQGEGFEPP